MKTYPGWWLILGVVIGITSGVALDNIPAGACLGTAIGSLVMLVSMTDLEKKSES